MRSAEVKRETGETKVSVKIGLDSYSDAKIKTPNAFLTHMLSLFAFHSSFSLEVEAESHDLDPHHVIEDVAITLGQAIAKALGDKKGIERYGWVTLPMDEALILAVIDISGRPACNVDMNLKRERVNDFPTEMVSHFFESLSHNIPGSIHLKQMYGSNEHHIIEAGFKAFGRALAQATKISDTFADRIPSSKGAL